MNNLWLGNLKVFGVFCLLSALSFGPLGAAETPVADQVPVSYQADHSASNEALRAYLQLQEQIHATQLALERNRQEAQTAELRSAEALSNRLQLIEQSLAAQRAAEMEGMRSSNRLMLFVLGLFAAISFMAVLLTGYFQWRAVHRLSEISAMLPPRRTIGSGSGSGVAALGLSENHLVTAGQVEQSNSRLFGIIERLEKRIVELEHTGRPALNAPALNGADNGEVVSASAPPAAAGDLVGADKSTRITFLLDKGQMLLDGNQFDEAVASFDEALGLDPKHAEALVKKGAALEKLRRPAEAIECYDRAIAADSSMTIAYLYKGGLCNRLERFSEAVECYEQALRTQEKQRAAA